MKRKTLLACVFAVSLSVQSSYAGYMGMVFTAYADTLDNFVLEQKIIEEYDNWYDESGKLYYPITPDSECWQNMTYAEQCMACEIPTDILKDLSNSELMIMALNYPFIGDVFCFPSFEEGLQHLEDSSGVFSELMSRTDITDTIIDTYASLSVDYNLIANTTSDDGEKYIKQLTLEILLAHQWKSDLLSNVQKATILSLQSENLEDQKNIAPDSQLAFLFFDVLFEGETIPVINSLSLSTTEGFIAGSTGCILPIGTTCTGGIYQKYGTSVSCYRYESGDLNMKEKNVLNTNFKKVHSNWIFKSTATKKYNCHSYCWISNTYTNIYWLNDPTNYTNASSYFTAHNANSSISKGDYIIIYDKDGIAHSAIALTSSSGTSTTSRLTTTTVISKIGTYGVYECTLEEAYNLYNGTFYRAYTPK